MRLFVGIALSDEAKEALERLTLRLRAKDDGLRWSLPEQWHITLVFLGSLGSPGSAEREALMGELRKIRSSAAPLQVSGVGTFDRVGILYAAVEVTSALAHLQEVIAATARGCEIEVEERPYRPHITLARSRNQEGRRTLEGMRGGLERHRLSVRWNAEEFLLYESELSPAGSRYRVQERFPLAKIPAAP